MIGRQNRQKSLAKRFLFILGMVMSAFYMVLGLTVIFWDDIPLNLEKTYRIMFGAFLMLYAILRLVKSLQNRREQNYED